MLEGDPRRHQAERFIVNVYAECYGAELAVFPRRLFVSTGPNGDIQCAAGLRFAADGFFSEAYLDSPIDQLLSARCGAPVERREVFEVSTLASRAPLAAGRFIREIVAYGERNGFSWSFFTLTHRLSRMVERLGLAPTRLGEANPQRVPNAHRWGSYYETDPAVYAVAGRRALRHPSTATGLTCHARPV